MRKILSIFCLLFIVGTVLNAADRHAGPGQTYPTVQAAVDDASPGDVIIVHAGTYREEVEIDVEGITIQPNGSDEVTINGTAVLTSWTHEGNGVYSTNMNWDVTENGQNNQVFVDGEMIHLTRWPKVADGRDWMDEVENGVIDDSDENGLTGESPLNRWLIIHDNEFDQPESLWEGAKIWVNMSNPYHEKDGQGSTGLVTEISGTAITTKGNGWRAVGNMGNWNIKDSSRYYLFDPTPANMHANGGPEAVLGDAEWWKDSETNKLYVKTPDGNAPSSTGIGSNVVEVKKYCYAFRPKGAEGVLKNVTIKGFNLFANAITTDNAFYGKLLLSEAENNVIDGITAKFPFHTIDLTGDWQMQWSGESGIILTGTNNTLKNSEVTWSAASAVSVVGKENKVLNNLIHHNNYHVTESGMLNFGPRNAVSLDHNIGYNTLHTTPHSGIAMKVIYNSDTWAKGVARIHHNIVYDCLLRAHDSGFLDGVQNYNFMRLDHNIVYYSDKYPKDSNSDILQIGIYHDYGDVGYNYVGRLLADHNIVYGFRNGVQMNKVIGNYMFNSVHMNVQFDVPGVEGSQPYNYEGSFAINNAMRGGGYGTEVTSEGSFYGWNKWEQTFVDAYNQDFRLQSDQTSLIDGGTDVSPFNDPVNGTAPDIGVIEFGETQWDAGYDANRQFVEVPEFSVDEGSYENVSISLSCSTPGAKIRYTTNGRVPSITAGTIYDGTFTLPSSAKVIAIAYMDDGSMAESPLVVKNYSVTGSRPADNPTATLAPGLNYIEPTVEMQDPRLIDFTLFPASLTTSGNVDNFDIFVTQDEDTLEFAMHFEGFINIKEAGEYTFYTHSDDQCQLRIGNTIVVSNLDKGNEEPDFHTEDEVSGKISLDAGFHAISVDYKEQAVENSIPDPHVMLDEDDAYLHVKYEGPGVTKRYIPDARLVREDNSGTDFAPQVSIIEPLNNAYFEQGTSYTIEAEAFDETSINKVEFYINNNLVSTDNSAPFEYTSSYTAGSQQVKAIAYDNTGNTDEHVINVTTVDYDIAEVEQTHASIAIDGEMENAWNATTLYDITNVSYGTVDNADDLSGSFKSLYSNEGIYFFVDVVDNKLVSTTGSNAHQFDGVEIYLDMDNSKRAIYDENDFHFLFDLNGKVKEYAHGNIDGIKFVANINFTNYKIEAFIPWSLLGIDPDDDGKFGLDVKIIDRDDWYQGKLSWWEASTDNAKNNPQVLGIAQFKDNITDNTAPAIPSIIGPANNAVSIIAKPIFKWEAVNDPSGIDKYEVKIGGTTYDVEGTKNTYTLASALANNSYSWQLRAIDKDGNASNWTSSRSLTVNTSGSDNVDPTVPILVSPVSGVNLKSDRPVFTWEDAFDVNGIDYYEIDITGTVFNAGSETSYQTTGLAPTNNSWKVRAVDNSGNTSDWSDTWSYNLVGVANSALNKTVAASSIKDGAVAENAVDGNSETRWESEWTVPQWIYVDLGSIDQINKVVIYWEKAHATDFTIDISDDATTWETVHTGSNGVNTLTNFTETIDGLNAEGRYVRITATAKNSQYGVSIWEFEVYSGIPPADNDAPSAPVALSPSNGATISDPSPVFTWEASVDIPSGIDSYVVFLDGTAFDTTTVTYLNAGVLAEGGYSWKVKAIDGAGNSSAFSAENSFTIDLNDNTAPAAPVLVSPADASTGDANPVKFVWNGVQDATGIQKYEIEINGNVYDAGVAPDFSMEFSAGTIEWRARAIDGAGNVGNWSSLFTYDFTGFLTYSLTAAVFPTNSGNVATNPVNGPFQELTNVEVTASPGAGYQFVEWQGAATGTANPLQVYMDDDKSVTAVFELSGSADLEIQDLSAAPVIDGTIDGVWSEITSIAVNNVTSGSITNDADLSGTFKAGWDASNLYILAEVTDDIIVNDTDEGGTEKTYEDDGVEVFIDIGNDKATSYGDDDFQYGFEADGSGIREYKHSATVGVSMATTTVTGGYVMEIAIPWTTLGETGAAGQVLGFEINFIDHDDAGTTIDGKKAWITTSDVAFTDPSSFGSAELIDGDPDPTYELTVESGSGSGNYQEAAMVNISADDISGKGFVEWTGDVSYLDDVNAESTTITMPAQAIAVTATYIDVTEYTLTIDQQGLGDVTMSPVGGVYSENETVTVSASAANYYTFSNWNGASNETTASIDIVMDSDKSLTAIFDAQQFGAGTHIINPVYDAYVRGGTNENNNYGATSDMEVKFQNGVEDYTRIGYMMFPLEGVTGTITGATLRVYQNWNDGIETQKAFEVTDDNWKEDNITYANRPTSTGSELGGWLTTDNGWKEIDILDAAVANNGSELSILLEGSTGIRADYDTKEGSNPPELVFEVDGSSLFTLTVESGSGGANYAEGAVVNIAADAIAGKAFDEWTGDVASVADVNASATTVTMPAQDINVTATYVDLAQYSFTTNVSGNGSIILNPAGGTYYDGTIVTATANADAGYQFNGWSGASNETTTSIDIVMDGNKSLTANFGIADDYTLTVVGGANGNITMDPAGGTYANGTVVAVTALPDCGYQFDGWTGDKTAMSFTTYITMDGNKTLNASFSTMPAGPQRQLARNGLGTLLTDRGTRLRGCYVYNDYYHFDQSEIRAGTKEGIYKIRDEYGMNALHSYTGWYATPTGTYEPMMDSLVKWTREAGIYLVMTIGGWDKPGEFTLSKVTEFWSFYAPKYADETHVIYEIMNEPENICLSPADPATISMNVEAYDIIRKYAPNTHVMVMSYPTFPAEVSYMESDLNNLEAGGIDFDNASVSYHGYNWCAKTRAHWDPAYAGQSVLNYLPQLQDKGFSFVNTEFRRDSTLHGNINYGGELIEFYENDLEISWLCFYSFPWEETEEQNLFNPNTDFKGEIDALSGEHDVTWCPDFGTWPQDAATCCGTTPPSTYTLATTAVNGSIALDPSGGTYDDGTTVTATATADAGYYFTDWDGASDVTTSPVDIVMDGNKSLTANFDPILVSSISIPEGDQSKQVGDADFTLTVNVSPGDALDKSVTWDSDNESVATVTSGGVVSVIAAGTANITATANDGSGANDAITVTVTDPSPGGESLTAAFAFGADSYTTETPNESGTNYVKVVQNDANFTYSSSQGHGYTETGDIDGSANNRNSTPCGEELYDQFIGVKNGGEIIFRVDVPNGDYRFVAVMGDASYSHTNTMKVRDGSTGTTHTLIDNVNCASDEYATVTFGDKTIIPCSGATFTAQPESPTLTVTNGYIEVIQATPNTGGDLVLVEIWSTDGGTPAQYTLTTSATNGSIALDPSGGTYDDGTTVTATANADAGYYFTDWDGASDVTTSPVDIVMDGNKSLTANFDPILVSSISIPEGDQSKQVGDADFTLTVNVSPGDALDKSVTWDSDNESVATVTSGGVVSVIAAGTANITAETNDGSNLSASVQVTVVESTVPVTGVSIDQTGPIALTVGGSSSTLTATVSPNDATDPSIGWGSDATGVATVDGSGVVSPVSAGTAIITVTTNDGGFTDDITVNVTDAPAPGNDAIPWVEDFTGLSDGTTSDNGSTGWTIDNTGINPAVGIHWVVSETLKAQNTDAEVDFATNSIDISSASSVTIEIDLETSSTMDAGEDYSNWYYKVDGGSEQQIVAIDGAYSRNTVTVTGVSGSSLEIVGRTYINAGNEQLYVYSISVTAEAVMPSLALYEAFAFGAESYTTETPNQSGKNYVKVVQDGANFTYNATDGHGYTETSDIDGSANNRNSTPCGEELYDQFIGVNNGGEIIFRVDVPNGDYQFVAVMGDARYSHTNTMKVRDGSTGTVHTLIDNVNCASDEYATVTFGDKTIIPCSGATFTAQPESPTLTVTNGYVDVVQATPNIGGDLVLVEFWSLDGHVKSASARLDMAPMAATVKIYPNPAQSGEGLIVELKGFENETEATISIMDISGRIAYSTNVQTMDRSVVEQTLNTNGLSGGMYMVVVRGNNKVINQRLIVR